MNIPSQRPIRSQSLDSLRRHPSDVLPCLPHGNVQISPDDFVIAVMGPTGSGKSSFINVATGGNSVVVGHSLVSCTREMQAVRCRHPNDAHRSIVFVDTPGFDDTDTTDADILALIAKWLTTTYRQRIRLSGLLFLHRISDNRLGGNPLRNLDMFRKLCGDGALQNVILVTTMWDEVEEDVGLLRQQELESEYWRGMIHAGSQVSRFLFTEKSAWEIIMKFKAQAHSLQLQEEMVDRGIPLAETAAGTTLYYWLGELIRCLVRFVQSLDKQMRSKRRKADNALLSALSQEKLSAKRQAEQAEKQARQLNPATDLWVQVDMPSSRPPTPDSYAQKTIQLPKKLEQILRKPIRRHTLPDDTSDASPRHGSKLRATIAFLDHAEGVAALAPVPFVKDAIGLALKIAKGVEAMSDHSHALVRIAEDAGWLIAAIAEQLRYGEVPEDLAYTINRLVHELKKVQTIVEQMRSAGRLHRYILQKMDEEVIAACDGRIKLAFETFELRCNMGTRQAIARIEQRMFEEHR